MNEKTCKNCNHYYDAQKHECYNSTYAHKFKNKAPTEKYNFNIGYCSKADDMYGMKVNQAAYSGCGHDGCVVVGEDFGCIHWVNKSGQLGAIRIHDL